MSEITVLRSTTTTAPKGYQIVELAYKTDEGKTKGMKIFGFGKQKENFEAASKAQAGDILEVTFQQSDKGYWEFGTVKATGKTSAVKSDAPVGSSDAKSASSTTRSTYETADERSARQVLIVRQSSVSNAIAYFEAAKQKPTVEDVVSVARSFEAYVFGTKAPVPQGDVE